MKFPNFLNQVEGWRSMFIFTQILFFTLCLLSHFPIIIIAYLGFQFYFAVFCMQLHIFEINTKKNNLYYPFFVKFFFYFTGVIIATTVFGFVMAEIAKFGLPFIGIDVIHLQSEGISSIVKYRTINYTLLICLFTWLIDNIVLIFFGWLTPKATILTLNKSEDSE